MLIRSKGQSMTEYLVVVSVVAIVAIPAFTKLGKSISTKTLSVAAIVQNGTAVASNGGEDNNSDTPPGNENPLPPVGSGEAISTFPDATNSIIAELAGRIAGKNGLDSGLATKTTGVLLGITDILSQSIKNGEIGETGTQRERVDALLVSAGKAAKALGSLIPTGGFVGGTALSETLNAAGMALMQESVSTINDFAHWLHENGSGRLAPPAFDKGCSFTVKEGSDSVCH